MTQLLSPTPQPKKSKNSSMTAIILAVLLHLLIAVVVYFAIFNDETSLISEESKLSDKSKISTSIIQEDKLIPADDLVDSDDSKDISAQSREPQDNKIATNNVKTTANNKENSANKNGVSAQNTTKTAKIPMLVEQAAELANNKNRTESANNSQQNQPEYKLKQTEEYQQLDADIDKDSEQLAELINEIKKRNQSQIQQHQTPQPNASDIKSTPALKHDYPITPIASLPTADDNKVATKNIETDR